MTKARQPRRLKKARKPPRPISEKNRLAVQARFLEAFTRLGTVTHAALSAGIDRQTHYNWLKASASYAEAFAEAEVMATDMLEAEARRRAVEGVEEPVFYQGVECGRVRKMSDTLLIFLLKGAKPEKYRERYEHSGPNGGPLQSEVTMFQLPENGR